MLYRMKECYFYAYSGNSNKWYRIIDVNLAHPTINVIITLDSAATVYQTISPMSSFRNGLNESVTINDITKARETGKFKGKNEA